MGCVAVGEDGRTEEPRSLNVLKGSSLPPQASRKLASPLFRLFVIFSCFPFGPSLYSFSLCTPSRLNTLAQGFPFLVPLAVSSAFSLDLGFASLQSLVLIVAGLQSAIRIGLLLAFGPLLPILSLRPTTSLVDNRTSS